MKLISYYSFGAKMSMAKTKNLKLPGVKKGTAKNLRNGGYIKGTLCAVSGQRTNGKGASMDCLQPAGPNLWDNLS